MKRPDNIGAALLQAHHVLMEWERQQLERLKVGFELQSPPVHYYAWGLFKKTIIKAVDQQELKDWSNGGHPFHMTCKHCEGEGRKPIPHDHEQYLEHLNDSIKTEDRIAKGEQERGYFDTPFKMGDPLWWHCTPCQGSGFQTTLDLLLEERNKEV